MTDFFVNKMIQFESYGIQESSLNIKSNIGWLSEINILNSYEIMKNFLKNAPDSIPQKNFFYTKSHSIFPFVNIEELIPTTNNSEELMPKDLILIITQNPDVWLNLLENENVCSYTTLEKKYIFRHKFNIVTPFVLNKKLKNFNNENWLRVIVEGIDILNEFFYITPSINHNFLWIIESYSLLQDCNSYYDFCKIYGVEQKNNNSKSWLKLFVQQDYLKYIQIGNNYNTFDSSKIEIIEYNTHEDPRKTRLHYNNNDYDSILNLLRGRYDENYEIQEKCLKCISSPTSSEICITKPCNHTICKRCFCVINEQKALYNKCIICGDEYEEIIYNTIYKNVRKTKFSVKCTIEKYIFENCCTNENAIIFQTHGSNIEELQFSNLLPTVYLENKIKKNYDELNNTNIKTVFLVSHIEINPYIYFFQINYPHIEKYIMVQRTYN